MSQYPECHGCKAFCWIPGCMALGDIVPCSRTIKPKGEPCIDHDPRETPLLVDALRNALLNLSVEFDHLIDHGAEPCDEDCAEEARSALTRYDEEVGDESA